MPTLNTAFKQIFGEALEPLGFQKIKGKHPYFVRVVPGGEIIHVITYANSWCGEHGKKAINIFGGVATVYRRIIDLSTSPSSNFSWLTSNFEIYGYLPECNREFRNSIFDFKYKENDETSMFNALEYSLKITREIMLPYINKANDLNACIAFLEKFNLPISTNSFKLNSNFDGCDYHDEGFLYIKTDYKELKEKWKKILNGETDTTDEMREKIAVKYKFFDDPIIQKKALEEIERRKVDNTERLSSYGFDVKKR